MSRALRVAGAVVVVGASLALAGCATPSRPSPPLTAPTAVPMDTGASALNSRILSQVSPPIAEGDLPLGPGDLIEISVFEVPELSNLKARVPLTGAITLPLLGTLAAAGRTPAQLQEEIRARLQEKYMHDPQVSVLVTEQKGHRISVLGAVRKGGVLSFTGPIRLADALAMAEGLADNADRVLYLSRRVPAGTLARLKDGEAHHAAPVPQRSGGAGEQVMVTIDLEDLARGNEELNVPLQPGDVIHVPPAGSYYVGGEVERAGTFPLRGRTTLDQAIIAAGGVKGVADWSDVRVYRTGPGAKPELLRFDLGAIERGEAPPDVQKNDVILVGKSAAKALGYGVIDFFKGIFSVGVGVARGF